MFFHFPGRPIGVLSKEMQQILPNATNLLTLDGHCMGFGLSFTEDHLPIARHGDVPLLG